MSHFMKGQMTGAGRGRVPGICKDLAIKHFGNMGDLGVIMIKPMSLQLQAIFFLYQTLLHCKEYSRGASLPCATFYHQHYHFFWYCTDPLAS